MPDAQCIGDVAGAMKYLRSLPYSSGKIGVIGYCSGGRQSYIVACNLPFDAAVDCYGGRVVAAPDELTDRQPVSPIDMTPNLSCPLLGLFGADDGNPSPEMMAQIEEALKANGKEYEFHTYEGAGPRVLHRRPPELQRRRRDRRLAEDLGLLRQAPRVTPRTEPASPNQRIRWSADASWRGGRVTGRVWRWRCP